jgi:hypothetical protein
MHYDNFESFSLDLGLFTSVGSAAVISQFSRSMLWSQLSIRKKVFVLQSEVFGVVPV